MINKTIRLNVPNGLHLRVAGEICSITKNSDSEVILSCEECPNKTAEGCSVIQMLMLEAACGKNIGVSINGKDEERVMRKIEEVFTDGNGI